MASLFPTSHPTTSKTNLDDSAGFAKPEIRAILPADVKHTEKLHIDRTGVILLLKERNFKVQLGVGTTSNVLGTSVSVFDTGVGPN